MLPVSSNTASPCDRVLLTCDVCYTRRSQHILMEAGGFIGQAASHGALRWRWTEWVTLIWTGLILVLLILFLWETYTPTLSQWRAAHLRTFTRDDRYLSLFEVVDSTFLDRLRRNLCRRSFGAIFLFFSALFVRPRARCTDTIVFFAIGGYDRQERIDKIGQIIADGNLKRTAHEDTIRYIPAREGRL
jgi:hypothetical protein